MFSKSGFTAPTSSNDTIVKVIYTKKGFKSANSFMSSRTLFFL